MIRGAPPRGRKASTPMALSGDSAASSDAMSPSSSKPRWGQNFLVNEGVISAIVEGCGMSDGDPVLEVGPGHGALTVPLRKRAGSLLALEIDRRLADALDERFQGDPGFTLERGDAAKMDWALLPDLVPGGAKEGRPIAFVANLPYDAATPILLRWLEQSCEDPRFGGATVMVQLEVAERLGAGRGGKTYGSLGVLAQSSHRVDRLIDVAPGSFQPPPKVRSRVVRLQPLSENLFPIGGWKRHAAFVHQCFSQRRKQLAGVLAGTKGHDRSAWQDFLVRLDHSPKARAEELSPADFAAMLALASAQGG
jgi:16S rRNA (adenine1518-N6/adenine1519-N6)-dimethyltransferase